MSGVSAARCLAQRGIRDFILLEGAPLLGGRVQHHRLDEEYNVEMGAAWIHGGKDNPLYELSQRYNVSSVRYDHEDYVVRNSSGSDKTKEFDEAYDPFEKAYEMTLNKSKVSLLN